jgi:hypothetical protein
MNPSLGPELVPVEVGRGGEEDVNVVARRVGLKRRDEGCIERSDTSSLIDTRRNLSLPNEAVVTQVFKHRLLAYA